MGKNKTNIIVSVLTKHIKVNKDLYKSFNFSHKQQKYRLKEYLIDILNVLKTGVSWRDLRSHIYSYIGIPFTKYM